MSERFDRILQHTLRWEGGYVNDSSDPGGATNHGISLRFLRGKDRPLEYDYDNDGDLDYFDMQLMSKAEAKRIYRESFWNEHYEDIVYEKLALKIFDFSVNMGEHQLGKLLQRSINSFMWNSSLRDQGVILKIDGIIGPKTLKLLKSFDKMQCINLLAVLLSKVSFFYYSLAKKKPTLRKYLFGWLNRCYDGMRDFK